MCSGVGMHGRILQRFLCIMNLIIDILTPATQNDHLLSMENIFTQEPKGNLEDYIAELIIVVHKLQNGNQQK